MYGGEVPYWVIYKGKAPLGLVVWEEPLAKLGMGDPPAKLGLGVWE